MYQTLSSDAFGQKLEIDQLFSWRFSFEWLLYVSFAYLSTLYVCNGTQNLIAVCTSKLLASFRLPLFSSIFYLLFFTKIKLLLSVLILKDEIDVRCILMYVCMYVCISITIPKKYHSKIGTPLNVSGGREEIHLTLNMNGLCTSMQKKSQKLRRVNPKEH